MKKFFSTVLVVLLVVSVSFGIYQYFYGKNLDSKLKAADTKLTEQIKSLTELKAKLVLVEQAEKDVREKAKLKQDSLQLEIDRLKQEKAILLIALGKEKDKTKTLSDSALASGINSYIGPEVKELLVGTFSLSRMGAENTLNIFKELTLSLQAWDKDKLIIVKQDEELDVFRQITIPSYDNQLGLLHETLTKYEVTLSACKEAYALSQKLNRRKFWKGLTYGVGGTSVVVVIFTLVKGLVK